MLTNFREIKLLQRLDHINVISLLNVFAKVEDKDGNTCVFPWFTTIEEEPIVWLYSDGTEEEKNVKLSKWYLVFEYCACSLQTILETSAAGKIPISEAHAYFEQLMTGVSYLHSKSIVRTSQLTQIVI